MNNSREDLWRWNLNQRYRLISRASAAIWGFSLQSRRWMLIAGIHKWPERERELNWIEWELNWKSWGNMISGGVNNQQGNQVIISGPRGQSRLAHRTSVSLVCSLVQCVLYVLVHSLFQCVKAHWSSRQKNVVIIFDIKFITWNKQKSIYRLGVVFKGGYVTKWGADISSYTLKGIRDLLEDRY